MNQFIGLLLIIGVISGALYLGTNFQKFSEFRISGLPGLKMPEYAPGVVVPQYNYDSQAPAIETASAPMTVTYVKPQTPYEYGEVVLTAGWNIPASGTDIKGWKIGSLGNEFSLPGAQEVYTFGGSQNSLTIRPGDEVHIFSGTSPRGNFRINKCIGYLSELGNFTPPLDKKCPSLVTPETDYLSNTCRSYLVSLSACEAPKPDQVSFNDVSCQEYMSKVNYESCVSRSRSDADFLDKEIWIWAGDNLKNFNPEGDVIKIFDKAGKLISQYRY